MHRIILFLVMVLGSCLTISAQDATVAPLMRLVQSGRLPKERLPQVVEMICQRGGAEELKFVFGETLKKDAFSADLRVKVVQWLTSAAETRKVQPAGDLEAIKLFLQHDPKQPMELTLAAIKLAAVWKVKSVNEELRALATNAKTPEKLRRIAIDGLAQVGDASAKTTLVEIAAGKEKVAIRMLAVAGLTRIDGDAAAKLAAKVLSDAAAEDDPTAMLNAFFFLKGGAEKLAVALKDVKLKQDVAKQSLRTMFAVGNSDAALQDILSQQAGIEANPTPPTQEEALKIAAEVVAKGNAARGEQIFRRKDLSCMNCHSISRAGGQIGPELSAVGKISPPDYIVMSILNPNIAIKEQFVTRIIETTDGKIITGIAIDRDDVRVVLRTADSRTITIPTADIESEEEGRSLMPQGLTKFLTQQEFYDLAKFVSELGKEGPYNLPTVPAIQRWRVLREPHAELLTDVPNVEQVREYILDTPAEDWQAAYAKVAGELPLEEIRSEPKQPLYLMGEVEVSVEGDVTIQVQSTEKVSTWIDALPFETQKEIVTTLAAGKHKLIFRVEASGNEKPTIRVAITKSSDSLAQFDIVGGQ